MVIGHGGRIYSLGGAPMFESYTQAVNELCAFVGYTVLLLSVAYTGAKVLFLILKARGS